MQKIKINQKSILWSILVVSLIAFIGLIIVILHYWPIGPKTLYPWVALYTVLPGFAATAWLRGVRTTFIQEHKVLCSKIASWIAGLVLLLGIFYILQPSVQFRYQIGHKPWIALLPVVGLYAYMALVWIGYTWNKGQETKKYVSNNREIFIDFARGFAILKSVGSHVFYVFGYDVLFGNSMYQVMSITRFATPSFVIITGMMFELVYFRKAEKQGFKAMVQSLLRRALQCYLAYLITVFIEWFSFNLTSVEAQRAVLFVGKSLFSGILKFYAIFLLLAIPVIWLRKRFGIWLISAIPVLVWMVDILIRQISWPSADQPIAYLTALVFGHPALSNFSVWHALTFMSFGMVLGYMLKCSKQAGNWRDFQLTLLAMLTICLVVSLVIVLPIDWSVFFFQFSNVYRENHQIPYYSIGSMGAFVLIWFIWKIRNHLDHAILNHSVTTLGKDSLWAFAVGNSLCAILPVFNTQTWFVVLFTVVVLGGSALVIEGKKVLAGSW